LSLVLAKINGSAGPVVIVCASEESNKNYHSFPAVKRLMKEAQELKDPTEQYFAQPLDVSVHKLFIAFYSKIPWYPKLLFQRENALASF
jgi:hypothetical protein